MRLVISLALCAFSCEPPSASTALQFFLATAHSSRGAQMVDL